VPPVPGSPVPGSPGPVPPGPGSPVPGPAGPVAKPRLGPAAGAIALGLGIVLLIIGAASQVTVVVIVGLVAAAWGLWRIVTGSGSNAKPRGPA
jgi:hypothetical protein